MVRTARNPYNSGNMPTYSGELRPPSSGFGIHLATPPTNEHQMRQFFTSIVPFDPCNIGAGGYTIWRMGEHHLKSGAKATLFFLQIGVL